MKRKYLASLLATLLGTSIVLSACTATDESGQEGKKKSSVSTSEISPITSDMPKIPAGLEKFYKQKPKWKKCGRNLECADFAVPLDYDNPKAKQIKLRVKKRIADKKAIGSLLVNPGGPGGSGQEMAESATQYFSANILENFDIIGFDPRGIGESTPVDCLDDVALGKILEASYPDTRAGEARAARDMQEFVAGCEAKSGKLLNFVGTESAARDMDVLRQALGDPRLYYVGYSYGTSLGGMYAQLFSQNVGRMVLDGAVAADASNFDQTLAQLKGFEDSLDAYLKKCLKDKGKCPFKGSVKEAREQIKGFFAQALEKPIPTSNDNRPLTQQGLLFGIITPLYDDANWPYLTQAFTELINDGTGSTFQLFFDLYTSREGDVFMDNSTEANWAVNCADYPASGNSVVWKKQEEKLKKVSPVFGPVMGYDEFMCSIWPYQPTKAIGDFTAKGSAPIVVVGTVGDPATPYKWAVSFAKNLDNATLVTYEGEGHTAYGRSTKCVSEPIDRYLLNGNVPKAGLTCPAK